MTTATCGVLLLIFTTGGSLLYLGCYVCVPSLSSTTHSLLFYFVFALSLLTFLSSTPSKHYCLIYVSTLHFLLCAPLVCVELGWVALSLTNNLSLDDSCHCWCLSPDLWYWLKPIIPWCVCVAFLSSTTHSLLFYFVFTLALLIFLSAIPIKHH